MKRAAHYEQQASHRAGYERSHQYPEHGASHQTSRDESDDPHVPSPLPAASALAAHPEACR